MKSIIEKYKSRLPHLMYLETYNEKKEIKSYKNEIEPITQNQFYMVLIYLCACRYELISPVPHMLLSRYIYF